MNLSRRYPRRSVTTLTVPERDEAGRLQDMHVQGTLCAGFREVWLGVGGFNVLRAFCQFGPFHPLDAGAVHRVRDHAARALLRVRSAAFPIAVGTA